MKERKNYLFSNIFCLIQYLKMLEHLEMFDSSIIFRTFSKPNRG